MKLNAIDINKIAQEIEAGMKVFINKKTLEFRSVLDWDDMNEPGFWIKEERKIKKEWSDFIVINKMEVHESFQIMVDFTDEIEDQRLKEDIIKILKRKSPFANFKMEIESSNHRQKWFDFRRKKHEDYIRNELDFEDIEHE